MVVIVVNSFFVFKMYKIEILKKKEISTLQYFIKNNWQENHVFVKSKELLLWQHSSNENLNYVIALNLNQEIIGVLGFIPTTHFDSQLGSGEIDIWLALWKADTSYPGVGMDLLHHLEKLYKPLSIGSIGINDKVEKLYKILKYKTGTWNQYCFFNSKIKKFQIATVGKLLTQFKKGNFSKQYIRTISDLTQLEVFPESLYRPLKSINFLINRYVKHPFYKYQFWGIYEEDRVVCILVTRKIELEGSSCIRIVDVLGDLSKAENISSDFDKILQEENAEYVDFINYGIDEQVFLNMGFLKRDDMITIPNYFEPFLKDSIDVKFAYKSDFEPYIIFKGDSDQDRPNVLPHD